MPFADTKLIEYLWNIPFNYKYKNNIEKYLLREAFKDILPTKILNRKKNPYPKTHSPYFKEQVVELLKQRLANKDSILYKLFDINKVIKLFDEEDNLLPWFGQLMTTPQFIAYLYQIDIWVEEYNIDIQIKKT